MTTEPTDPTLNETAETAETSVSPQTSGIVEPSATSDHGLARETWESGVPGDESPATDDATLPDQIGADFTLRETAATETPTDYEPAPLPQEGTGYARREETATEQEALRTEHAGEAISQDGEGYVRHDFKE